MLVLSNEEIEALLTIDECINVLEELYRDIGQGKALNSPRIDNLVPCSHEGAYYAFKHMGGSWPRRRVQALRINSDVITHPNVDGRPRRVKVPLADGRWVGLVQLYDTETGELLALFPDGVVQRLRVGATNGLAARYMARADARQLGLIGSGWQAGAQLMAFLAVFPGLEVKVFSSRRESRESFAAEWSSRLGKEIRAVDSPEECARDVDILAVATSSLVPVLRKEWLREGLHVSCIKTQEVDAELLARCHPVVVHTKGQIKGIDNVLPGTPNILKQHRAGWWNDPAVSWDRWPELSELVLGSGRGRTDAREITCFVNNVGSGLQFAAVGALALEKAQKAGIGTRLPRDWFSESVHP